MRLAVLVAALVATVPAVCAAANADPARDARLHYDRGMAHYELGEFRAAVNEFKQAYALSQAPGLLFNLAQASRLGKDYDQALHFYRTYLRVRPDAPNREDVEKRIVELEPIVEARRQAEVARLAAPPVAPPSATTPETPRSSDTRPRPIPPGGKSERIAGLVVGAIGVGALGAGLGLGLAARSAQNRLTDVANQMGNWSADDAKLYQTGQREALAATSMYVIGGAAVATGVILYVVGVRKDRARFAVLPAAGGGAQAVWSWSF
jgi:tetratricopeptide (TPR) repeat protein